MKNLKSPENILAIISVIALITYIGIFVYNVSHKPETVVLYDSIEDLCINSNEIVTFDEPKPVVWEAQLDGCLSSCYGASFTRTTDGVRFAGYYPDTSGKYIFDNGGLQIPEEFMEGPIKIYGDWEGIEADHPFTVFEDKCVPIVMIKKIEKI